LYDKSACQAEPNHDWRNFSRWRAWFNVPVAY
jgi:hypothetical protein